MFVTLAKLPVQNAKILKNAPDVKVTILKMDLSLMGNLFVQNAIVIAKLAKALRNNALLVRLVFIWIMIQKNVRANVKLVNTFL